MGEPVAEKALAACDAILGLSDVYARYGDRIPDQLISGIGEAQRKAQEARNEV